MKSVTWGPGVSRDEWAGPVSSVWDSAPRSTPLAGRPLLGTDRPGSRQLRAFFGSCEMGEPKQACLHSAHLGVGAPDDQRSAWGSVFVTRCSSPDPALEAWWWSVCLTDLASRWWTSVLHHHRTPLASNARQFESVSGIFCSSLVTGRVAQHFYHPPGLPQSPLDQDLALNHHFLKTLTSQQKNFQSHPFPIWCILCEA